MKQALLFIFPLFSASIILHGQSIGIGTSNPDTTAILHLQAGSNAGKGFLVTGVTNNSSTVPDLGPGSRMMFYPGKGAFRAGSVNDDKWNNINVGSHSVAMGLWPKASGSYSTSIGYLTQATGSSSVALGNQSWANGIRSVAIGYGAYTNNYDAIALGPFTTSSGLASVAIGYNSAATGNYSVALGTNVSTNGYTGSFFFGDSDPHGKGVRYIGVANQFATRFHGGYYFISNDDFNDVGVYLPPGGNAWASLSDVRRKEKFLPIDHESVLGKISNLNLTTWNYIGQDPKTFRHYGPMAQDFYAAFGKDEYGSIGCDTLINQADFDGLNLVAIQALEKRTQRISALEKENSALKTENDQLKNKVTDILLRLEKLETRLNKN